MSRYGVVAGAIAAGIGAACGAAWGWHGLLVSIPISLVIGFVSARWLP